MQLKKKSLFLSKNARDEGLDTKTHLVLQTLVADLFLCIQQLQINFAALQLHSRNY